MERWSKLDAAQLGWAQARAAHERAVRVRLGSVARHEAAARHLEQLAAYLEQRALTRPSDRLREQLRENGARARRRAAQARARAQDARRRLRDQGISSP